MSEATSVTLEERYEELMQEYAVLRSKVEDLHGNGKPGRVAILEVEVNDHNLRLAQIKGGLMVLTILVVPILLDLVHAWIGHLWK